MLQSMSQSRTRLSEQRVWCFPGGSVVKNPHASAADAGLISGLGRSLEEGNGKTLQNSCLGNPMDRGAWQATVPGVSHDLVTERTHTL